MTSVTSDMIDGVSTSKAEKAPCIVATTANITLSGEQDIDGVSVTTSMRVLVKDQTAGADNGVYNVATSAWSRAPDWDGNRDVGEGTHVFITRGSTNAGTMWYVSTQGDITIGTTSVAFARTQFTNATTLNNQAASYYTNSTNQDSGTLPRARLPASVTDLDHFYPSESSPQAMTVDIGAGKVYRHGTLTSIAAQTTSTITAPSTNPRIDRVIVDKNTGVFDIITGTEAASPSAPGIPSNAYPVCQISLTVSTTEITDSQITDERVLFSGGTLPKNFITGFVPSTAADTDHDITWTNGECRSADNASDCIPTWSTLTKQIDATWAEGTNAGGMATGTVANSTEYSVNLIRNNTNPGNFDITFDVSFSGANTPSGWTFVRRIDAVITDGSANIRRRVSAELGGGQIFHTLYTQVADQLNTTTPTSATLYSLTVPGSIQPVAKILVQLSLSGAATMLITSPSQNDSTPTSSLYSLSTGTGATFDQSFVDVLTNNNGEIRARADTASASFDITTIGWLDRRT